MPTYPIIKTYRGGFYNNKKDANGNDDRVYTAEDVRKPYDAVFTDGVKPDADGTAGGVLAVTATGGLGISIAAGHAKLGGAWFENDGAYNITLDGGSSAVRYDCVILRNDDNDDVREASILIKSLSAVPTVSDLQRDEKVYEVCIAYVRVPALATSISASNITDTREDGSLCNIMSGVGAMVVRTFHNTYFSETAGQTVIPIGIPQYNKARDELTVIVEGRVFTEGANYTINSNSQITLAMGLPVIGTKIVFEVAKNVNAAGAETVVQEVAALRTEMTAANKILEHHYYCNGATDNLNIGSLVYAFQVNAATDTAYSDYASMRLVIHGTFGATSPRGGAGTSTNPYYWIRAAQGSASNRRVILDFTDCKQLSFNCDTGTYNIIFFGMDVRVVGANVNATGGTAIYMFSLASGTSVYAENCRFWITCDSGGMIARSGTFKNCRASVTNTGLHSYCFVPTNDSLLRLDGGEYYAYTGSTDHVSAVVGMTSGTNAIAVLYAVNAPTVARSGYRQTNSVYQTTGIISCTDLISALPLSVVSGSSNIRGTIALSKAGLM